MLKLLSLHGANIDPASTNYPWYHFLMQSRGECDNHLKQIRKRFEDEFELNHSKRRDAEHQLIKNTSGIDKRAIFRWLSDFKPEKDHDRIYSKRHENTGLWFLDSEEMSLLWCHGSRKSPGGILKTLFTC